MSIKDYVFYVDNCICGAYIFILPTLCCMFTQVLFWSGNQGNHQNFDPSLLPKKLTDFHGDEAIKIFEKKIQTGRLKKTEFFKTANSQYFIVKILEIGPRVSRMN